MSELYTFWNKLELDNETTAIALPGDIVEVIDGVAFLCQRTNNCNNIVAKCLDNTCSIKHIRAMFKFCIKLWEDYDIEYVRIEGTKKRYKFIEHMFSNDVVRRDGSITERNVYFCNIRRASSKLKQLINYE